MMMKQIAIQVPKVVFEASVFMIAIFVIVFLDRPYFYCNKACHNASSGSNKFKKSLMIKHYVNHIYFLMAHAWFLDYHSQALTGFN